MIRHIVLTKFKPTVAEDTSADIYNQLGTLINQLSFAGGFTGGRSQSPEQIERGYKHGFVVDFDSWDALQQYTDHPEHKRLGSKLVDNAVGGINGILVLDLEVDTNV